jgi:hypothetical protein
MMVMEAIMNKFYFMALGFILLLGLSACQPSNPDLDPNPTVTLTFINDGSQDWILENVEGATGVGTVGAKDTPLTLSINTRYTLVNNGGGGHPFQLLDSNIILLSELDEGSFENDPTVKFVDGDNSISFTLTQALADVLDSYNCAFHIAMSGPITVE